MLPRLDPLISAATYRIGALGARLSQTLMGPSSGATSQKNELPIIIMQLIKPNKGTHIGTLLLPSVLFFRCRRSRSSEAFTRANTIKVAIDVNSASRPNGMNKAKANTSKDIATVATSGVPLVLWTAPSTDGKSPCRAIP